MAYETTAFGSADGSNVTSDVSNHYGQREIGNQEGQLPTSGMVREMAINFDGDTLDLPVFMPADSYVVNVITDFATGSVTAATVGGTDVSAADGTAANVAGPVDGEVIVTGPTAGSVVLVYRHIAA
tara:strand:+ start:176 stop:553 length:378 start_codon:yes stop_codon:yes gene_type:complete